MKINLTILASLLCAFSATSQTAITSVDTSLSSATSTFTYANLAADTTYNWGVSPYDTIVTLTGFIAGGIPYTYDTSLTGNVKLRRVDNATITGNYTLEWVEGTRIGAAFYLYPDYQNDMEVFLNNHVYNKGTDNLFDNSSANSNDIERLDWILTSSYSTPFPDKVGFAVFDKGAAGTHDPFCIAAITSVDGLGNPLTYGNIVRVVAANYGDPGPSVTYRILKGPFPSNLFAAGNATQNLGGVFITLQDLGITANTPIYGYSLIANDLPVSATPADLVDYTNATFFHITTGNSGGLDLVAVTGINEANSVLPVNLLSFNAVENNDIVNLNWTAENEASGNRYDVERSEDGVKFLKIKGVTPVGNSTGANSYSLMDNVSSVASDQLYYRIKEYEPDGSYLYSKTILVRRNNKTSLITVFPNPVRGNLYLNIINTTTDRAVISVFNSVGAQVLRQQEQLSKGNNSFTIDGVSKLSKGAYQLSIKWINSGRTVTKQFSKQ